MGTQCAVHARPAGTAAYTLLAGCAQCRIGILHLTGAGLLCWASTVKDFKTLHVIMLMNAMCYMPTIALNNAVAGLTDMAVIVEICSPLIGVVGFIVAM